MIAIAHLLEKIRKEKPLVHHITNWVTIYDCANIVRMLGALPVMAHTKEESAEMQAISNALVLNIGTLTPKIIESMLLAAKKANDLGHPVVLDAVGVGATRLRTEKAVEILEKTRVGIVKGNPSEIAKLAGAKVITKGVESTEVNGDLFSMAKDLAKNYGNTVVVTGKHDIVAAKGQAFLVKNGHEMLGNFVGTGCMAASVLGCFAAVEPDLGKASVAALSSFGIAGELAAEKTDGPAAFKQEFFDQIYKLDSSNLEKMQQIEGLE